ncbi:hypothetical protein K8354_12215 [Polaribacter litorisediminis]|uniref:hypothetical protein n=1 Tax=Polaribacter litorisediminis TaxID=1908341 RepID=UPI001CBADA9C|nr:hypothetical protein [Polaribacter litorisediminis]UAM97084.1 hypothetical protein K8354_12215 [Polaribacter litorisediminis]
MDLKEFKEVWKKEQNELISRIDINEKKIGELEFEKSKNEFDKYINTSIMGRNFALIYFMISILLASQLFNDELYSIPALIGGFAMLFSFFQHLPLKKPNYSLMTIIELQRTINSFRIHTLKYSKFDTGIVILWLLSIIPVLLKLSFKISILSNFYSLIIYSLIGVIAIIIIIKYLPFDVYKKWDLELKNAEKQLNEVRKFEAE